ncbi:MAG: hypothetical protein WAN77_05885, partial [Thermoplasmata archaeon]
MSSRSPYSGPFYWVGAYNSLSKNPTSVSATITTPDAAPGSGSWVYVLLSIWDNAQSYDQIGFLGVGNYWDGGWSVDPGCSGNYDPDFPYTLADNHEYTFTMEATAAGNINFLIYDTATSVLLYSDSYNTGGTGFFGGQYWQCTV